MGRPSRESYLAAEKRRRALRTRDGIVDLAEWRAALPAVAGLERLLHDPPWLEGVRLAPAAKVGFELRVTILSDSAEARACLPTAVNEVPVRVIVRNPGVGRAGRS
ncbi:hypothetical protein [Anaeromyxobacter oryzae]|uniref:DUF721 domain-containing protein n=1 Tax=Anaeromyxobacter oryzae TaxID=2918170 RepID=A0ABM7WTQ8_9BACT|nr:hypothetical protein [Anaeromyxobacter oryzae]BDG02876.1 hypothetical protein AMOR_18720 [Anaeromyxobacter oryzae]